MSSRKKHAVASDRRFRGAPNMQLPNFRISQSASLKKTSRQFFTEQVVSEVDMYDTKLPQQINPLRLAQHADTLCGHAPLAGMSRLAALLDSAVDNAHVMLAFALDEWHRPIAKGTVQLVANLTCQRCLKPLALDLLCEINWAFVKNDDQAKQIQEVHDPILVENEKIDLLVQIEDEIILNLPMIALHEDVSQCGLESKIEVAKQDEPKKKNPFADLANFKIVKKYPSEN